MELLADTMFYFANFTLIAAAKYDFINRHYVCRSHDPCLAHHAYFCEKKVIIPPFFILRLSFHLFFF